MTNTQFPKKYWHLEVICFIQTEKYALQQALWDAGYKRLETKATGVTSAGVVEKWTFNGFATILLYCVMSPTSVTALATLESGRKQFKNEGLPFGTLVYGCAGLLPRPKVNTHTGVTLAVGDIVRVGEAIFASWGEIVSVPRMDLAKTIRNAATNPRSALKTSESLHAAAKVQGWIEIIRVTGEKPNPELPPTRTSFEEREDSAINKLHKVRALVTDKVIKTDFGLKKINKTAPQPWTPIPSSGNSGNYDRRLMPSLALELDIAEMESHAFGLMEERTLGTPTKSFEIVRVITDDCVNKNDTRRAAKVAANPPHTNCHMPPNSWQEATPSPVPSLFPIGDEKHKCRDWDQLANLYKNRKWVVDWINQWKDPDFKLRFIQQAHYLKKRTVLTFAQHSQQHITAAANLFLRGKIFLLVSNDQEIKSAIKIVLSTYSWNSDKAMRRDVESHDSLQIEIRFLQSMLGRETVTKEDPNTGLPVMDFQIFDLATGDDLNMPSPARSSIAEITGEILVEIFRPLLNADNHLKLLQEEIDPATDSLFIGPDMERAIILKRIKTAFSRRPL